MNNNNPNAISQDQVRNKTWENAVVRAEVLDVFPQAHSVRVNPRGENAPFVCPVLALNYESKTLPDVGERVIITYITDNVPVCIGSVYLADGERPPTESGLVLGNNGSAVVINDDGSISISTGEFQPVDIDSQSGTAFMNTDQTVSVSDTYTTVQFNDTLFDDPENLFDEPQNAFVVRSSGLHRFESTVEIEEAGNGVLYTIALFKNGVEERRRYQRSTQNVPMSLTIGTQRQFDAGDIIDVRIKKSGEQSRIINSNSAGTEFSIQRKGI